MLYFTEDDGLSRRMEKVSEEFDRECDEEEYEAKIGSLVRSLESHLSPQEKELWDDAVLKLCEGDHYLLVLIDAGAPPKAPPKAPPFPIFKVLLPWLPDMGEVRRRPAGDKSRLLLVALVIFAIIFGAMLVFGRR